MSDRHVTLFHAPHSRSAGVRVLLEELQADYDLRMLDFKSGQQRAPEFIAINPMGKVPAVRHGNALVTEQPAIYIYLADLYADAGLAPALDDALRGPYLRWLVFYGSCFEPAVVDRALKRDPAPPSTSPYGDWDTMLGTLVQQLTPGPWLLGERFTAADVLWGTALTWTTGFRLLPLLPAIEAYMNRVNAREAVMRSRALDEKLLAGGA